MGDNGDPKPRPEICSALSIYGTFGYAGFRTRSEDFSSLNQAMTVSGVESVSCSENKDLVENLYWIQYVALAINIFTLLAALAILIGVYRVKVLWVAVYSHLIIMVLFVIATILYFVYHLWIFGAGGIISFVLTSYFTVVLRSYAFEMDRDFSLTSA